MPATKRKPADPVHPVLRRFCDALEDMYGDRIERIVLYGSRARGEAHSESDYDVAVFLRDLSDRRAEERRLWGLTAELRDATEEDIHAIPFPAGSYGKRTPLMHAIRQDGIDLGPPGPPLSSYAPSRTQEAGMSPEAAHFLAQAREALRRAQGNLAMDFAEEAGRHGYMAALHAARGLIFERSGRFVKTHKGVKARFAFLARDEPSIDAELRSFLASGFELKRLADYFEPGDRQVSVEEARSAIETATRFVDRITALLNQ
jgi:uncharacterized protein